MFCKGTVSIIIPVKNERIAIKDLIRSIQQQSYRPIEVVVVDGGSTDSTLEVLSELKRDIHDEKLNLKILKENANMIRSPANARNIGILDSSGEYLVFLDADMSILDNDFIDKVRYSLNNNQWVMVKGEPLIDSNIEKAIVADSLASHGDYVHCYCGTRRELFSERLFDSNLGFGEDTDFFDGYINDKLHIKATLVDTYIGIHQPHTLGEFIKQNRWYGRTSLFYLRKHYNLWSINGLKKLLGPSILLVPFLLFTFSFLSGSLLLFIIAISLFVEQVYKVTYKKAIRYMGLPAKYRALKVFLISTLLEHVVRPFAWGLGLLDLFIEECTGRSLNRGRE